MTVTTQLIGKLGGGGAPETAETKVSNDTSIVQYSIPSGWKKAQGVFTGTAQDVSPMMFGQWFDGLRRGTPCSGGGVVTDGQRFQGVSGTITWVRLE